MKWFKKKQKNVFLFVSDSESVNTDSFFKDNIHVSVKKIAQRDFYDSTWMISIDDRSADNKFSCSIVRSDDQTIQELIEELKKIPLTEEKIRALDKRQSIFYD